MSSANYGQSGPVHADVGQGSPAATSGGRFVALTYIGLLALALLCGYLAKQRMGGIFACGTQGYGDGRYLSYCHGESYGDYDHGAIWFGLEPAAAGKAAAADLLFLGNSRVQ